MTKARNRNNHKEMRKVPQLSWSPLNGLRATRQWRVEVVKRGGFPVGVFWTARKWPLNTERPVRVGLAEWSQGLPERTDGYELWNPHTPGLRLMLTRAMRSMLFMYGSWWFLAMFLAIDVTRNIWVQVGLMGGGTLLATWISVRIIRRTRWVLRYDPGISSGAGLSTTEKGRR